MYEEIRRLLTLHHWVVDDETDSNLMLSATSSTVDSTAGFRFWCGFGENPRVVIHEIFDADDILFSNLRIYVDEPIHVTRKILESAQEMTKENYTDFVNEIYLISNDLIFDDNGVWVKVDFS